MSIENIKNAIPEYAKVDEIPFDFQRRTMTVVVRTPAGQDRLISKGAPEDLFARCKEFELDGERFSMDHLLIEELKEDILTWTHTRIPLYPEEEQDRIERYVLQRDVFRALVRGQPA